jgi:DNA-binding NtrC family response regulator
VLTGENSKRRILAVDDDSDITLTVTVGLEASGLFEVDTFNDPELALSNPSYHVFDRNWFLNIALYFLLNVIALVASNSGKSPVSNIVLLLLLASLTTIL